MIAALLSPGGETAGRRLQLKPALQPPPAWNSRRNPIRMRADLVEQAAQVIPDPPTLINLVSKRVKQITAGRPTLVERRPGLREADIALLEIIQGKLKIQDAADEE